MNKNSSDSALQERLILHYSRMAEWLETWPWYRDDKITQTVLSFFPASPSRVLELCCGSGLLLDSLSRKFQRTEFLGIDISTGMVERARERLALNSNVAVLQQDWIYELGLEWQHTFDVIVVKNALHLLDDVVTKLKDLKRVSHDRTILIIVETISPNVDANRFIKRLFRLIDPEHLKQTFFTEKTLGSMLKQACWFSTECKPTYVKQHISTEDWLAQKYLGQGRFDTAKKLLSETRNLRVRQALDFDTEPGTMPTRMLRLQYIARHVFASVDIKAESHRSDSVQLQLL
ncbi:MAG TPA: class I SAM-dependent methyltransferase [Candidatus Angelobacter sp.]|nr:class I SAM-dependent methyltransferase [Candidatus Angelobacter sp.]